MAQRPLVSIVTPFFNEGGGVKHFYQVMAQTMEKLPDFDFEIVCVDDGSRDNTLEQLIAISKTDPRVTVLEFSRNFGKEPAMTAGIDATSGDCVIPIDADLQDPPALIAEMLKKWQEGAEVVLAKRVDRSTDSYAKRTTALMFYRLHNTLSGLQIPENVGDFRLMDRVVVDALKQLPERQRFMKGLFAWVGFKTATVEYVRDARLVGDSKFSGWKLWNFAIEGITSFSLVPLKVWTYVGGIGALFAFCYAVLVIIKTLVFGIDVPGYASLLVVILFFGSLQLICLGVLGEYIGRIYFESKQRPLYLIRKRYSSKA
ncbi:glycosyltransferase family 2 protein [Polynucleobacter sp. AP-Latsch-80-C2]|jgi:glycosyltransferase involved in cell wall biosynthesis|nr:glycosyltransferase family 2 protein [Polynucleobacter sp. AP-Latsch-80-C2]MBU3623923.1 glycosyltransferase family 2 protein [Polynucleobacter sp. AP-Latsch-80-C2]